MAGTAGARRRQLRRLRRQIGWLGIPMTYTRTDLASAGHLPLFVDFTKLLGLEESLDRHLTLSRRERCDGFTNAQLLWILADAILFDVDRIENIRLLGTDPLLARVHGLPRVPDPETVRNFLECFDEKNVKQLLAVNREVISRVTGREREPVMAAFVSDETVLTVYGDQEGAEIGYNPKKHGRPSYQGRLCALVGRNLAIHAELRGGKERSLSRAGEFYDACFAATPENVWIASARLDCGHFSQETCEYFESARPLAYYLKVRVNARMKSDWHALPDEIFTQIEGDDREIAKTRYRPATWKRERTFVILRRRIPVEESDQARLMTQPTYEFEAIVTNDEDAPALDVFRAYNSGADVENLIRELKYEYFIDKIGSGTYLANAAHFTWKVIVHNLVELFKREVLPESWARRSLKTLRAYVFKIPGVLTRVGRGLAIALPAAFPFQTMILEAAQKLHSLAVQGFG